MVNVYWLLVIVLSPLGLHFCGLPMEIFLLGQSDNFSCAPRKFRLSI
jgi:hypothetical protein